jgi:tRNA modification GTPase
VIRQTIELHGIAITLSDTAGLREAGDAIEKEGIDRAYTEMKTADLIVEVLDDNNPEMSDALPTAVPLIRVYNKVDLSRRPSGVISHCQPLSVAVSATEGTGLEVLENLLVEQLGFGEGSATTSFSARERHVDALTEAADLLSQAIQRFSNTGAGELLAEDLRQVHDRLARITGKVSADDLLGEIFSSFCIGK